jgi:hypothetical protein
MARSALTRVPTALAGGLFEVGDAPVGDRELVFKADDAPGRSQGHVLIEQFSDPGGQRELGPAVARVRPGYGGNLPLPALMRGAADGLSWSRVRRHSV